MRFGIDPYAQSLKIINCYRSISDAFEDVLPERTR